MSAVVLALCALAAGAGALWSEQRGHDRVSRACAVGSGALLGVAVWLLVAVGAA